MSSVVIPDDLGNLLLQWEQQSKFYTEIPKPFFDGQSLYPAAVLMPLFVTDDGWHLLYTRRTNHVGTHQGEVSFPGGAADDIDDVARNRYPTGGCNCVGKSGRDESDSSFSGEAGGGHDTLAIRS